VVVEAEAAVVAAVVAGAGVRGAERGQEQVPARVRAAVLVQEPAPASVRVMAPGVGAQAQERLPVVAQRAVVWVRLAEAGTVAAR
jgi:hypothetical protein